MQLLTHCITVIMLDKFLENLFELLVVFASDIDYCERIAG